jgi:hypothetical protein
MMRPLAMGCFFLAAACGYAEYSMLDTGCIAAQLTVKK